MRVIVVTSTGSIRPIFLSLITFSFICLLWQLLLRTNDISENIFPGPVTVFGSLWQLIADGSLLKHTVASLYRVTVGFYLAAILGIPLGIILGCNKVAMHIVNPVIQFLVFCINDQFLFRVF